MYNVTGGYQHADKQTVKLYDSSATTGCNMNLLYPIRIVWSSSFQKKSTNNFDITKNFKILFNFNFCATKV